MRPWKICYAVTAVATSLGAGLGNRRLHAAAKYAVAPTLATSVISENRWTIRQDTSRNLTLLAALAGSAVGDHFMLAESRHIGATARGHMRRGAASFAVQQLGLLTQMHRDGLRFRRAPATLGTCALAGLAVVDGLIAARDGASTRPDPIIAAYGTALTAMAALSQDARGTSASAKSLRVGGCLFFVSDAIIVARQALPRGRTRNWADAAVMATYTTALALLIDGLRNSVAGFRPRRHRNSLIRTVVRPSFHAGFSSACHGIRRAPLHWEQSQRHTRRWCPSL